MCDYENVYKHLYGTAVRPQKDRGGKKIWSFLYGSVITVLISLVKNDKFISYLLK